MTEEFENWFNKRPLPTIGVVTPKGEVGYSEEALRWAFEGGQATRPTPSVNEELLERAREFAKNGDYFYQGEGMGIVDELLDEIDKLSKANAQAQQDDAWIKDAVIVLEEDAEPMVGDVVDGLSFGTIYKILGDTVFGEDAHGCWEMNISKVKIIQRNGKPVVYRPKAQQVKKGG